MRLYLMPLVLVLSFGCRGGGNSGACIQVDGKRASSIADAVARAEDGAEITLCASTFVESVLFEGKRLTVTGAGVDDTLWSADGLQPALLVNAGGDLTLRDISFESTSSPIVAQDSAVLTVERARINEAGGYGIESVNALSTLLDVEVLNTAFGGIRVTGGTLDASDLAVRNATFYGIVATDDAVVRASGATMRGIAPGEGSQGNAWGLRATSRATITIDGGAVRQAVTGAQADGGALNLTDVAIIGGSLGLVFDAALPSSLTDVTVDNVFQWGVFAIESAPITASNLVVTADPAASWAPDETPAENLASGAIGLVIVDTDLQLTGGEIAGHLGAGAVLFPQRRATQNVSFTDVTFADNHRAGLFAVRTQLDATRLTVRDTVRNDAQCRVSGSILCNMGIMLDGSSLVGLDLSLINNGEIGLGAYNASADLTDTTVSGHSHIDVYGQNSALNLFDIDITTTSTAAIELSEGATALVQDGRFVGSPGTHALIRARASLVLRDTDLTGGDRGLRVLDGTIDHDGGSITNVNVPIELLSDDAAISVRALTIDRSGEGVASCWGGALRLTDVGVTAPSARGLVAGGCALSLSRVTFETTPFVTLDATDCEVELEDVSFAGATIGGTVQLAWVDTAPAFFLRNVLIGASGDAGLLIARDIDAEPSRYARLQDVTVGDPSQLGSIAGDGVVIAGVDQLDIVGLNVRSPSGDGLVLDGVTGTIAASLSGASTSIIGAGGAGLRVISGAPAISGVTVTDAGGFGLDCDASPLLDACDGAYSGALGAISPTCDCP